jgi:hypothetical protein
MKHLFFLLVAVVPASCQLKRAAVAAKPFVLATLNNRNVYKTKGNLAMKKIYVNGNLATDKRDFTLKPYEVPPVTKTVKTVTITRAADKRLLQTKTVEVVSTVPETSTTVPATGTSSEAATTVVNTTTKTTEVPNAPAGSVASTTTATATTTLSVPAARSATKGHFIRYKVLSDEGDNKYIEILPQVRFGGTAADSGKYTDTDILVAGKTPQEDNPTDYVFMVSKKDLMPHTHYLATSALIGKVITIPLRVRNEYWNGDNKVLQGTLALSYGFGWKYKLGNNPYKPHYFTTILYAAGISQQKHFFIAGKFKETGKDSISAKTDEIAVTYWSFGAAYEYDKFNIGVFAGKDKMFGSLTNWAYQDKWWFGLGIGYDLFK